MNRINAKYNGLRPKNIIRQLQNQHLANDQYWSNRCNLLCNETQCFIKQQCEKYSVSVIAIKNSLMASQISQSVPFFAKNFSTFNNVSGMNGLFGPGNKEKT